MKKERIETLVDSFTDKNGNVRYFVIAAISIPIESVFYERNVSDIVTIKKGLKIGFSICNPEDKFDENLGKTIAIGRARKSKDCAMLVSEPGYINTKVVQAFLKQEAEYFKNNPESRIAGYK